VGALQPLHLFLILAIVIMLFGATRIPEIMRGVGEGMRDLRKATREEDAPAPKSAAIPEPPSARGRDVI
jgi:sec-independent protein translocase protein TatA